MDSEEKRRHPRQDVFTAVMVSPNGHEHRATVFNLSESGARLGLPSDFERNVGADLRVFFTLDDDQTVMLNARIVRVAVDHLGLQFGPSQEQDIRNVMSEFAAGAR